MAHSEYFEPHDECLRTSCKDKKLDETLRTIDFKIHQGIHLQRDTIFCLLQGCLRKKDLTAVRRAHSFMLWTRLDSIAVLADHLIRIFASCGSLLEASQAFSKVANPTVYTWNAIISAHANFGEGVRTLDLYHDMVKDGKKPDEVTFSCVIKACSSVRLLEQGKLIHQEIVKDEFQSDLVVGNTLIDMYAKHGSLEDAHKLFNRMPFRDVVSWSSLVSGYAAHDQGILGLQLFEKMQGEGIVPDRVTFLWVVKSCNTLELLGQGRLIHDQIIRKGLISDSLIGTTLLDMYAKCGSVEEAHRVFDELPNKNLMMWVALIAGYAMHGFGNYALELFESMQLEGFEPSRDTLLLMMNVCGSIGAVEQGRFIHDKINQKGLDSDLTVAQSLLEMYAKCGSLEEASTVFAGLPNPDARAWNALVLGYAQRNDSVGAFDLFEKMVQVGIKPSEAVLSFVVKTCGNAEALRQGMLLHDQAIKNEIESSVVIGARLVDMYATCGSFLDASKVFDRLLHADVMLLGSRSMVGFANEKSQRVMILCMLRACGSLSATSHGRLMHEQTVKLGLDQDTVVGNTLINMYAKCGNLKEAQKVFDVLQNQDSVSWGSIIAGYMQHGHGLAALELFKMMQLEGVKPSQVIFSCILKACGIVNDLELGHLIHEQVVKSACDTIVGNTLIYMYVTCGSLKEGRKVFDELPDRDVVSWCSIIEGYANDGQESDALELYENMQAKGVKPNEVIFLCILKACRNIGALGQGRLVHDQVIRSRLELDPAVGSTLVDMYAKCRSLVEARKVLDGLPYGDMVSSGTWVSADTGYRNGMKIGQCFEDMQCEQMKPNDMMCTSALTACSHAGSFEEGRQYFESMRKDFNVGLRVEHYGCMSDLLSHAGLLKEAGYLLQTMPMPPDTVAWMALLTNCRTYGNVELGRHCFNQLALLNPDFASGFMMMSNIYADACLWEDVSYIRKLRQWAGLEKQPCVAWVGDNSNAGSIRPSTEVRHENLEGQDEGVVPQLGSMLGLKVLQDEDDDSYAQGLRLVKLLNCKTPVIDSIKMCLDCHHSLYTSCNHEKQEMSIQNFYCMTGD